MRRKVPITWVRSEPKAIAPPKSRAKFDVKLTFSRKKKVSKKFLLPPIKIPPPAELILCEK